MHPPNRVGPDLLDEATGEVLDDTRVAVAAYNALQRGRGGVNR